MKDDVAIVPSTSGSPEAHKRDDYWPVLGLALLWTVTFVVSGLALAGFSRTFPNNAPAATNPFDSLSDDQLVSWVFRVAFVLGILSACSLTSRQVRSLYSRIPSAAGLVVVLLWLVSAHAFARGEMADDTWIYMRVADMVRQTGLPLWNPQDRFTPATSFIWPYLLAIGADPDQRMLVSSVVSALLLGGVAIYTWHVFNRSWPAVVLCAALCLSGTVAYWGSVGMETSLAVAAVAAIAIGIARNPQRPRTWLLGGCLVIVRPELVLLPVCAAMAFAVMSKRRTPEHTHRSEWRSAFIPLGLVLLPLGIYAAINRILFLRPLPTPLYFKGNSSEIGARESFLGNFPVGISEALGALSTNFAAAALAAAAVVTAARSRRLQGMPGLRPAWALLFGALALFALNVSWGYQHMGYGFRYFQPSLVALAVASFVLASPAAPTSFEPEVGMKQSKMRGRDAWSIAITLMALVSSTSVLVYFMFLSVGLGPAKTRDWFSAREYTKWLDDGFLENGRQLALIAPSGSRVYSFVQIQAMGLIPDSVAYEAFYAPIYLSSDPELQECSAPDATPTSGTSFLGYPPLPGLKRGPAGYLPSMECLRLFDFVVFKQGEGGQPRDLDEFFLSFENVVGDVWKRRN